VKDRLSPASWQARLRLLAVGAVLLASGLIGFLAYRLAARPIHGTVRAVASSARPPAPEAAAGGMAADTRSVPAPRVPERLPEIELPGTDGKVHRLADWKGKPLVVNFWATWCDPCRREIPLLKALRREHAADSLEIVGIAVDYPAEVQKYVTEHGIDYPVMVGDQGGLGAVSAFGMETVLPFSVFADRAGQVVTLKVGELHKDEAELILDRLRELDAGRLTLAVAQQEISAGVQRLQVSRAQRE
jgi:thiol-disulfide isomerase/thioredoxin